jgi:hypothetical protein
MIDKDTAIKILRSKFLNFAPNIPGIKPISIQRANEIADLIESLSAKADAAEKLCCPDRLPDDSIDCANCFLLGVCRLRAGREQG